MAVVASWSTSVYPDLAERDPGHQAAHKQAHADGRVAAPVLRDTIKSTLDRQVYQGRVDEVVTDYGVALRLDAHAPPHHHSLHIIYMGRVQ